MKPRLLDLFCGAGGAAVGYHRAGFEVVGVDIAPQPNYPFEFHRDNVFDAFERDLPWQAWRGFGRWTTTGEFDAIHASPPCQRWTRAQRHRKNESAHPDLITPLRPLLEATVLPYVIENVEYCDALGDPVLLCGSMFDLDVQNHRLFEANWPLVPPVWPCRHGIWAKGRFPGTPLGNGKPKGQTAMVVNRMASGVTHEMLANALGIDWMPARGKRPSKELSEAIPPAYTEFIGHQLMQHIRMRDAA